MTNKKISLISICLLPFFSWSQVESEEVYAPDDYTDIHKTETIGNYSISRKSNKYGVYKNSSKTFVIPPNYERIDFFINKDTVFIASFSEMETKTEKLFKQVVKRTRNVSKQVLINTRNEIISKKYQYIQTNKKNKLAIASFSKDTISYKELINVRGKEVSKRFQFLDYNLNLNVYCVKEINGKAGILNSELEIIIPFEYDFLEIRHNDNNTIVVRNNNKYGVIDLDNNILIPLSYEGIRSQFEDNYIVKLNKKQVIINGQNKIVIDSFFDRIYNPDLNGNFALKDNGKYGLMNSIGNLLIPVENNKIYFEKIPNYYVAKKDKLFGIYNKKGELIIPILYNHLILVVNDSKLLKTIDYNLINRIIALKDGKAGVIDMNNNIIIPFKYSYIELVNRKDKRSLIDDVKFSKNSTLKNYIYKVSENGKDSYFINEKNEIIKN
ncbi:WG repeat-containing protein [Cellulophaga baltica]|uniref:WG repeat-containing protein n=1 Tax=Cellulophaga baltica TaxID=76594 RepID=UPI0024945BC4|nr:WG repeat-containing protein [Cellulophaga baltica]